MWLLLEAARERLERCHHPDGYNIGVNVGVAAGQTVMHVHVHLVPRYNGDMADPVGGVRNVLLGNSTVRVVVNVYRVKS